MFCPSESAIYSRTRKYFMPIVLQPRLYPLFFPTYPYLMRVSTCLTPHWLYTLELPRQSTVDLIPCLIVCLSFPPPPYSPWHYFTKKLNHFSQLRKTPRPFRGFRLQSRNCETFVHEKLIKSPWSLYFINEVRFHRDRYYRFVNKICHVWQIISYCNRLKFANFIRELCFEKCAISDQN